MARHGNLKSRLAMALFFVLTLLAEDSSMNDDYTTSSEEPPHHVSWTSNNTRFDFLFKPNATFKHLVKLESDASNFLTSSLEKCTNSSACLFKNGTLLELFQVNNTKPHESVFSPINPVPSSPQCESGNIFTVIHYCSTHKNPPLYLNRAGCHHIVELHSPFKCHNSSANHEHPCYVYESSGKLIDLNPWILSNGSSYIVDKASVPDSKIKEFHINVCNEAHDSCGPNVSSCYIDEQAGLVESGYNNLTSIKYEPKEKVALLTSLGQYNPKCEDSRIRTVIRFICKDRLMSITGPKLLRTSACESVIDWPTIRACPMSEIRVPATECRIHNKPLGFDIDIKKLVNNRTLVEIPHINLDGRSKKMAIGICQGLPKSMTCEGKQISTTKACLLDESNNSSLARSEDDSIAVGSVTKSFIRFADDRIYLESFAHNKTCSEQVRENFNVTQQVGTRIEFFCSKDPQEAPTFLGYDDCIYAFEWGSPLMCLESLYATTTKVHESIGIRKVINGQIPTNVDIKLALNDEGRTLTRLRQSEKLSNSSKTDDSRKMNGAHKYFMITLIFMSLVAFIAVIFIIDKKTRLRITLRQARQVFQQSPQPYSRVVNDLDL